MSFAFGAALMASAIGGGVAVLLLAPRAEEPMQVALPAPIPRGMADVRMGQLEVCRQRVLRLRVLLMQYRKQHGRLPDSF